MTSEIRLPREKMVAFLLHLAHEIQGGRVHQESKEFLVTGESGDKDTLTIEAIR